MEFNVFHNFFHFFPCVFSLTNIAEYTINEVFNKKKMRHAKLEYLENLCFSEAIFFVP